MIQQGVDSRSSSPKGVSKRAKDIISEQEQQHHTDHSKKRRSSSDSNTIRDSNPPRSTTPHPPSPITVVLPSSCTDSEEEKTSCHDISRDPSVDSLLGVSNMDLEVDESETASFCVSVALGERSRTESTYLRPEELPPCKVSDLSR
jgi:hypothetical protein